MVAIVQIKTRSRQVFAAVVDEVLNLRPHIEKRFLFIGTIQKDTLRSVLAQLPARDRQQLFAQLLYDCFGTGMELSGSLGEDNFTITSPGDLVRTLSIEPDQLELDIKHAPRTPDWSMMRYAIDVAMPSGAVSLGPDVVCDGFLSRAKVRVQTHFHADHMSGFETSKGNHIVLASNATISLLTAEYNADLPYRTNIIGLTPTEPYTIGGSSISLIPNGHMLGSVQVKVVRNDGLRLGYSGDIQWPIDDVMRVDGLVVDSTYGSPRNVREFTQGECEEQFLALLHRLLSLGPVNIKAHRGTVQRVLQLITDEGGCPIICSERLARDVEVIGDSVYTIGDLFVRATSCAREVMSSERYIRVYSTGDQMPVDIGSSTKIVVSAYFTRPDTPVMEYSEGAFGVAMSDHADFEGTLEYIRQSEAEFVVTDNTRGGKGVELAEAIISRLGVEAKPSSAIRRYEWGM